ncbi:hypothetical protein L3X38_025609 [Prunus dulcis]|uniref:Ubiquitin-like protease family profile domain-containing protein n=1 Tax=Prunus dulcis TaxID=3755 RepID=A0AAD4W4K0_PRUDU|nr:hypothetical protein L3X38_025609 [Prunus dulcis]
MDKVPEFRKLNAYIFQRKQQLRNEVAVLHHEKGQLEERVLCLEKCTSHADARKTGDAGAERNKTKDAGEERNKTEDDGEESQKTEDEDAREESQKTEDAGEESDKTEDGGVAESREQCVQNAKEKIDMSTAEGECGVDVIVGVRQKRGRGKSEILGLAMKRRRAVVRETPWTGREIPNISEDTIADPLRLVPCDSLLEVAKFCWEWGQEETSHVRLCGEDYMEGLHNFCVRLLTKDGWLDDSNIDMALLLLWERHESSGNWKCVALDYKQMKAYVGKEDRQHSKCLLGMVKGEGPKLAKSWSSVNCVCLPFNLQRQKHWILFVVDLKECEIRAYDSKVDMCKTQAIERAVQQVVKMLPRLLKESGYIGDGLLLKSEWPVIRVMDAPQQAGGGYCGMYILKYCEFLTSNVELAKISHDAMPFYQLKLAV